MTILDDLRALPRVLLFHAHPDDETLATGALALLLADAGVEVQLVTATRGERGEVVPGSLPEGFTGTLEDHRATELAEAAARLGVRRRVTLGTPPAAAGTVRRYRDSGMEWVREGLAGPAADAGDDAFSVVPVDGPAADLRALVAAWAPGAIVSYDADGGYGHPDHLRAHEVASRIAAETGIPFVAVTTDREAAQEWHDAPGLTPRLVRALEAYRTQLAVDGAEVVHVGGQRQAVETWFGLRK